MSIPNPYGQPPTGEPYPYGQQPYGQQPQYGQPTGPGSDRRPGTVTAAAWITIVFSGIVTLIFGFTTVGLVVARDQVIAEMEKVPEFQEANIDADAAVGVLVAVMLGLVVWSIIAIVLAVFVLRRSNVARILLVISSSVTALLSLLSLAGGGVSLVPLIAAVAVIVLLFVGGAGDWFKRLPAYAGGQTYSGYTQQYPSPGQYGAPNPYGDPYGQAPGQDTGPQYPPPSESPYGQQPGQQPGQDSWQGSGDSGPQYPPPSENPYGQPPAEGGDHPPKDYPGR